MGLGSDVVIVSRTVDIDVLEKDAANTWPRGVEVICICESVLCHSARVESDARSGIGE